MASNFVVCSECGVGARMKTKSIHRALRCRKGDSVYWVKNVKLPDIDLPHITHKLGLHYTEDLKDIIDCILSEFIALSRKEEKPLADECKSYYKSIIDACNTLESLLELDAYGVADKFEPMKFHAWGNIAPNVECFVNEEPGRARSSLIVKEKKLLDSSKKGQFSFDGKNVADYLAICRKNAQRHAEFPRKVGPRKKYAITRVIKALHKAYKYAGGKGRGCWWYESKQKGKTGEYRGPFLDFASMVLESTDYSIDKTALGTQIMKNIVINRCGAKRSHLNL